MARSSKICYFVAIAGSSNGRTAAFEAAYVGSIPTPAASHFQTNMEISLKFAPHLVPKILSGVKTTTWRLFDDKNLKKKDELIFINKETGVGFGKAKIAKIVIKKIKDLTDDELKKHEYNSREEMIESHKKYYGDKVNDDSEVKIITFVFKEQPLIVFEK
jgi:hypothetical protein